MMRSHFKHHIAVIAALAASVVGSAAHAGGSGGYAQQGAQFSQQVSPQQRQVSAQQVSQQDTHRRSAQRQISDGALAGVISASNRFEIEQATIARKLARTQEVKDFAKDMLESHSQSERRLSAVLKRLRIKVESTRASAMLVGHSSVIAGYLSRQPAQKFDRAFIATQVMTHRYALRMLDEQIIPRVSDETLKQELQRIRGDVARHLERAREIQATLKQGQEEPSRHEH